MEGNGNILILKFVNVKIKFSPKGLSRWKGMETSGFKSSNVVKSNSSERTFPVEGNGNILTNTS